MKSPHSGSRKPYATIDIKPTKVEETAPGEVSAPAIEASVESKPAPQPADQPTDTSAISADIAPTPDQSAAAANTEETDARSSGSGDDAGSSAAPAAREGAVQPSRGSGFISVLTHLAAGFGGGFIALLAADSIGPRFGLSQQFAPAPAVETQRRLGDLEKALATRPGGVPAELNQKLATLENRLAQLDQMRATVEALGAGQTKLAGEAIALEKKVASSAAAAPADVSARVAKLEDTLATMAAAGATDPQSGRMPQLAALAGRIGDLEATLANQIASLRNQVTQDLHTRTDKIAEASEAAKSGTQRIDRELASAKADASRINQRIEALKGESDRIAAALQGVREEGQALKSSVEASRAELTQQLKSVARPDDVASAVSPIASKLSAMEQTVQGVVKNEADRKATAERIVLALELANLKRALDRGGAYAAELSEVKKVAGPRLDLTALEARKGQGVPTLADLMRDFRQAAHDMLDAETERGDASVLERLVAGAKSVIRVRKVGQAADDKGAEAVIARMEQALQDGRSAAVVDEAKKLSPKARGAAHDWLAAVEARAAVDTALAQIDTQLKATLTSKPGTPQGTN